MTRLGALLAAAALFSLCAADAVAESAHRPPDAEILAANTTAVITDPNDARLNARLVRFKREVTRMIRRGGGRPRGSQLLDGVFFSSILDATTFQRSRDFDVDSVSRKQLRAIADRIRRRYQQQSVLTFDYAESRSAPVDAIEVEVPGVSAKQLRDGFAADTEARDHLLGGSVTLDRRLILIAALEDRWLVKRFVNEIGGDFAKATVRRGKREFVG